MGIVNTLPLESNKKIKINLGRNISFQLLYTIRHWVWEKLFCPIIFLQLQIETYMWFENRIIIKHNAIIAAIAAIPNPAKTKNIIIWGDIFFLFFITSAVKIMLITHIPSNKIRYPSTFIQPLLKTYKKL